MSIFGTYDVFLNGDIAGELTVSRRQLLNVFAFRANTVFDVSRLICLSGGRAVSIGIPVPEAGGMSLTRSLSDDSLRRMGLSSIDRCLIIDLNTPLSDFSEPSEKAAPEVSAQENSGPPSQNESPSGYNGPVLQEPAGSCGAPEDKEETVPSVPTAAEDQPSSCDGPDLAEAAAAGMTEDSPAGSAAAEAVETPRQRLAVPGAEGWYFEPEPWRLFSDASLSSLCRGLDGAMVRDNGTSIFLALPYSPNSPFPLIPAFRSGSAATIGGKSFIVYRIEDGRPG
ncbi:MAG: hypothetical protein ACI3VB_03525 [Oscillospiraceae bacterium]